MGISVSLVRPDLVTFDDINAKPCYCDCRDEDFAFKFKHCFNAEIFSRDTEGNKSILGIIENINVNMDDAGSIAECNQECGYIIKNVMKSGKRVDNLVIIKSAAFSDLQTFRNVELALSKIYCIYCRLMILGFCEGSFPAIVIDWSSLDEQSKRIMRSFLPRYEDGSDIAIMELSDNVSMIYKIENWQPSNN